MNQIALTHLLITTEEIIKNIYGKQHSEIMTLNVTGTLQGMEELNSLFYQNTKYIQIIS